MIKLSHMKIAIITAVTISITSCKSTSDAPESVTRWYAIKSI
jgi:hypothetical protein